MSKFRRVSETENIPAYIEQKFVGASVEAEDPYAHLREASQENQARIARQQFGMGREAKKDREFQIEGPSIYENRREMSIDERIAALKAEDFSPHAIRRSDYGTDDGDTAREVTASLKAFSPEDYMNVMLRGASSIWNPDMFEVAEAFMESHDTISEQAIADAQQRREARKTQHTAWENEQMEQVASLRESRVCASRANGILRTAIENEAAGNFGLMDVNEVDENEARRIAMLEAAQAERLKFKASHRMDRNQRHASWEQGVDTRAKTFDDIYTKVNLGLLDDQTEE